MDEQVLAEVAVHTPMARRSPLALGDEADASHPSSAVARGEGEDHKPALGLTFHYGVPWDLAETLRPGHLVWVPFGKQELHGIVLDLISQVPSAEPDAPGGHELRSILDLVLPEPVCTPAQLDLARWLSVHTLSPVLDCVLLMLPPGLIQKAEPVLELTDLARRTLDGTSVSTGDLDPADRRRSGDGITAFPESHHQQRLFPAEEEAALTGPFLAQFPHLRPEQHALLVWLQERGQTPERVLARQLPEAVHRRVIEPLIEDGLIARRRRVVEAPIKPKTGKQVTLLANQETIGRVLPTMGHSSKQADVLAWLAGQDDPTPSLAAVCQAVDSSPAPVRSLTDRGWVAISAPQRLVKLLLGPAQAAAVLADDLSRAPAQAAALQALVEATSSDGDPGSRVDEDALRAQYDISTATLAALEGRGYVQRMAVPALVTLLLSQDQVPHRLIELRGAQKYRPVLDALAGESEPVWVGWLYAETGANLAMLRDLEEAGLIAITEEQVWRDPLAGREFVADHPPALTQDQALAWREIERAIAQASTRTRDASIREPSTESDKHNGVSRRYLLHGVTGSGKTEIYLRAIDATLKAGQQAIVLVPEIALTPQTVRRFAARFGEQVTVYHSDLSAGERYDVWRRARSGAVGVVVGTRSALFLPLPQPGLIVLDEEHDPSYKESQRPPRYQARDAALFLGQRTGAVVILGSATPSLETYHAASQLGQIRLLELPRRIMGHAVAIAQQQQRLHVPQTVYRPVDALSTEARFTELPPVQVVDLRQELRAGNRSMFSRSLQEAITRVLRSRQQAILFLNRRGSATFVICRDCGHVQTCEHCDVPLTFHERKRRSQADGSSSYLVCHHCGRQELTPERCPECSSRRIRYLGAGTEKIAELVQTLWPDARVVRWDRDVTGRKGSHDTILDQFVKGDANIMVGTQMIAKGLDLPLVTLVGVISADVGLYLPDVRAAERSFQVLAQVAGRAGRSLLGGEVIIQSYRPEHYVIQAARRHDYADFYRQELGFRRQLGYPPFRRLARLLFVHANRERAQQEAEALARGLRFAIHEGGRRDVDLIGPAPCFFGRERGKYRWQIVVRAPDPAAFLRPLEVPQGWRIDVDPVNLL